MTNPKAFERDIKQQLLSNCMTMLDFATDSGHRIPPALLRQLQTIAQVAKSPASGDLAVEAKQIQVLTNIHNYFVELVSPAKPRTLLLQFENGNKGLLRFAGNNQMVLQMRSFALVSLACLVGFSLCPGVNVNEDSFNLLKNDGLPLLYNIMFILSAASMGACFAGLYTANQYIKRCTFDNIYVSSYWTRYVLGLMSGIMIAMLIPVEDLWAKLPSVGDPVATVQVQTETPAAPATPLADPLAGATVPYPDPTVPQAEPVAVSPSEPSQPEPIPEPEKEVPRGMSRPLLALLGGFAASFVYRVLDKLVKMLEAAVKSDPKEAVLTRVQAARVRLDSRATADRLTQVRDLNILQQRLADGASPEEIQSAINAIKENLARGDSIGI